MVVLKLPFTLLVSVNQPKWYQRLVGPPAAFTPRSLDTYGAVTPVPLPEVGRLVCVSGRGRNKTQHKRGFILFSDNSTDAGTPVLYLLTVAGSSLVRLGQQLFFRLAARKVTDMASID